MSATSIPIVNRWRHRCACANDGVAVPVRRVQFEVAGRHQIPADVVSHLHRQARHVDPLYAAIRSAVPGEATEVTSYRIPTFKYKGPLLGFAAFSNHCSLFPMSSSHDNERYRTVLASP